MQINECPQQIWNLDETSMSMNPSKTKVVGARGVACSRTTSGPGRENTTILSAVNANGEKAQPLIVFKGKNIICPYYGTSGWQNQTEGQT